jgi:hypothetical protein
VRPAKQILITDSTLIGQYRYRRQVRCPQTALCHPEPAFRTLELLGGLSLVIAVDELESSELLG